MRLPQTITLTVVLLATAVLYVATIALATLVPELGDEPSFKVWANHAVTDGIHQAYRSRGFGYDWLPFYLYVSKSVGLIYHHSGLASYFGRYHHLLTVCLKMTMMSFHLVTVSLVYSVSSSMGRSRTVSLCAALGYGIAPGTLAATAAFGYQDAFHTMIVVAALWCIVRDRSVLACALTVAAALTKPQAAIYLGPVWLYVLLRRDLREMWQAILLSATVVVAVLSPFLWYGTLSDVYEMYLDVPQIHQWLTGCAHNIWWLIAPVPPFVSDRMTFLPGINGLRIGLSSFALTCVLVAISILNRHTLRQLAHGAAFLAFAFFMVVTQIHENHLYACFPFLAIAATEDRRLVRIFAVLTLTFAADMVLTLYLLYTDVPVMLGPIRLSLVNAAINVGTLMVWARFYIRDYVVGWWKKPG
jgi:Gpi18-like mannosyltransferase